MSNALAIAAATATLRSLLLHGLGISDVTTKPPDLARKGLSTNQVNLFLYQTTVDAAWRNQDLLNKVKPGETGQPPLPLRLHYVLTAYGDADDESKGQQLLGRAMSLLQDHPLLGAEEIKLATETDVAGSDLHEQIERVRISLQPFSIEELSKLWTAFQTNYRLSATYQVEVVLLESTRSARTPLPVLTQGPDDHGPVAQGDLVPPFPALESITIPGGRIMALLNDQITLAGHHLALDAGDPAQVRVAVQFVTSRLSHSPSGLVAQANRTDTQIKVTLPHPPGTYFPAGLYQVSVNVQPVGFPEQTRTTNSLPLMLAPTITKLSGTALPVPPAAPVSVARTSVVNGLGTATLQVTCSPQVLPEQSAALLIGDQTVSANAHPAQTDTLTFAAKQMAAGTFRLRLRIDGVDSAIIDATNPAKPKFDDSQRVTLT
jgi:hypothetical protein